MLVAGYFTYYVIMFAHRVAKILKIDLFHSNHNGFNIFIQRNDSSPGLLLEAQLSLLRALIGLLTESSLAGKTVSLDSL